MSRKSWNMRRLSVLRCIVFSDCVAAAISHYEAASRRRNEQWRVDGMLSPTTIRCRHNITLVYCSAAWQHCQPLNPTTGINHPAWLIRVVITALATPETRRHQKQQW